MDTGINRILTFPNPVDRNTRNATFTIQHTSTPRRLNFPAEPGPSGTPHGTGSSRIIDILRRRPADIDSDSESDIDAMQINNRKRRRISP